jgi:ABC-type glycerol-3-phosphate transport system substrate-binding protein
MGFLSESADANDVDARGTTVPPFAAARLITATGRGEDNIMPRSHRISRRRILKVGAGATALPLVHIRTAGAAGKLSFACVTHRVPGADDALRACVGEWAKKAKTEVSVDIIDSNAALLMVAAEAQARTGHNFVSLWPWHAYQYASQLELMDDVMQRLSAKYGAVTPLMDYIAKVEGSYRAVPAQWNGYYL